MRSLQEMHAEALTRLQENTGGTERTRKDTPQCRFGTVRPRVQIPGPRPVFELRSDTDYVAHVTTPLYRCSTRVAHRRKCGIAEDRISTRAVLSWAAKLLTCRRGPG